MKKIKLILLAFTLMLVNASCHRGSHVSIRTNDNGQTTKLEYSGKIAFAEDNMAIKSMANNSFIRFEANGQKLIAEREYGNISYILNDGPKTNTLNDDGRQLISEVLKKLGKMDKKD